MFYISFAIFGLTRVKTLISHDITFWELDFPIFNIL